MSVRVDPRHPYATVDVPRSVVALVCDRSVDECGRDVLPAWVVWLCHAARLTDDVASYERRVLSVLRVPGAVDAIGVVVCEHGMLRGNADWLHMIRDYADSLSEEVGCDGV